LLVAVSESVDLLAGCTTLRNAEEGGLAVFVPASWDRGSRRTPPIRVDWRTARAVVVGVYVGNVVTPLEEGLRFEMVWWVPDLGVVGLIVAGDVGEDFVEVRDVLLHGRRERVHHLVELSVGELAEVDDRAVTCV